ncbi:DUF354 domain-containing protein (plasmid) [Haloferacaceae archaeon DSL9]
MKVLITMQHPAHVHFYKHVIAQLETRGHDIHVFVRDKGIIKELLESYEIPYTPLVTARNGRFGVVRAQLRYEYELWRRARRLDPDVMTAIGGIAVSHVSKLIGSTSVVFTDSGDHVPLNRLGTTFADVVCTPKGIDADYGPQQLRYDGYHELAYLHPKRFEPDESVLLRQGIDPNETYALLRFGALGAHHDHGWGGISDSGKRDLVERLSNYGGVFIANESELPPAFEAYRLPVAPADVHHLLYYANLYVGDSQTMATEAALLGTPTIRSNSFAGDDDDMSNFVELEHEYDLMFSTTDERAAIERAEEWIADPDVASSWKAKRRRLFDEKIEVTDFVTDLLVHVGSGRSVRTWKSAPDPIRP